MNKEHLSLADLVRLLESHQMNRSLIQRYDAEDDFREVMQKNEETKTYPGWTLPLWEKIAETRLVEPLLVRPKTAARYIKGFMPKPTDQQLVPINRPSELIKQPPISDRLESSELIELPAQPVIEHQSVSVPYETLERLLTAVERHANAVDEILTLEQATKLLDTTANRLCRLKEPYIRLGKERRHWRWRKSDLIG